MAASEFKSFVDMFHHRVRSTPDLDAIAGRVDGTWVWSKWSDVGRRVKNIAGGLRGLGIQTEQRVAILSGTRVEWILADLGILCAGGATTTIYPSNTAEECQYILTDSDSVMVFCDTQAQVSKLQSVCDQMPKVVKVILFDGASSADGWVITLADLEKQGEAWNAANPGQYDAIGAAIPPTQLATLIYTSGTTGKPKGVYLTHDCWVYEGQAVDAMGIITPSDRQFLWLPLAHSFGKVLESAFIRIGVPTAIDGDVNRIPEHCGEVQPTFMGAPPRIFEKAYTKAVSNAKDGGGMKWAIFNWAIGVGKEVSKLRQQGKDASGFLAIKYKIADKLVFSKLKARFGGRVRFFISGAAALNRDIAEFFHAADILILEGYGLTETSAASFVNRPDRFRFGTVGIPLDGTEVKIAEDGEILIKGRGVMQEYYNLPEATAETLKDGWLHTGDIGEIHDGFLKITDRKKDLIKTSGGKYIAPQELEGRLKAKLPLLSQVVIHGEKRNFVTMLVTLSPDTAEAWAKQNNIGFSNYEAFTKDPVVLKAVETAMNELNKELPSYSTIKKFAILPADLSVEEGDLTPSMKIKRKHVEKKHAALLDSFYAGSV